MDYGRERAAKLLGKICVQPLTAYLLQDLVCFIPEFKHLDEDMRRYQNAQHPEPSLRVFKSSSGRHRCAHPLLGCTLCAT